MLEDLQCITLRSSRWIAVHCLVLTVLLSNWSLMPASFFLKETRQSFMWGIHSLGSEKEYCFVALGVLFPSMMIVQIVIFFFNLKFTTSSSFFFLLRPIALLRILCCKDSCLYSNSHLQWLICTWNWYFLYAFPCLFVQVPMVLCIKGATKPQAKWLQWRKYV